MYIQRHGSDLEIIILNEVGQRPYNITYMWNLKYDTNELIYETKKDLQTQRTDLWLPKQWGVGEGREGLGVWS